MEAENLELSGFRSFNSARCEFAPGINVITGENAAGKTNLLEAVYMLTGGRSFRTRFDREIIGFSYGEARIVSDVRAAGNNWRVDMTLRRGRKKSITYNAVTKTAAELGGAFSAVLFCPEDLSLISSGAVVRRRFTDLAISQLRPGYAATLTEFTRLHEHKTRILRDHWEKPGLLDTLDSFTDSLLKKSAALIRYRAAFTGKLSKLAAPIHREFSGGREELTIRYKTVSTVEDPLASERDIYAALREHYTAHRDAEIRSGTCLTGAHKDDLEIEINGNAARSFASQGQTRTAAISVKLAEREIHLEENGEYPILLLDDVLSELDTGRQEFLLNRIGGGQTLVTCCEGEDIKRRTGGRVLVVENGTVRGT